MYECLPVWLYVLHVHGRCPLRMEEAQSIWNWNCRELENAVQALGIKQVLCKKGKHSPLPRHLSHFMLTIIYFKGGARPGMVVHACNFTFREVRAGGVGI